MLPRTRVLHPIVHAVHERSGCTLARYPRCLCKQGWGRKGEGNRGVPRQIVRLVRIDSTIEPMVPSARFSAAQDASSPRIRTSKMSTSTAAFWGARAWVG